jgi:hypothetical protein
VRHPIPDDIAAKLRDDFQSAPRVILEAVTFVGIELITDENGDRHRGTPLRTSWKMPAILGRDDVAMLRRTP